MIPGVLELYAEPHRHHHTMKHINEMLSLLEQVNRKRAVPNIVTMQLAILYHDAIYDPRRGDNEERSAELAVGRLLYDRAFPIEVVTDVSRLVLSTKKHGIADRHDEALLSDLDLAILGGPWRRYDEYAIDIQKEYDFVPEDVYRRERKKILQGFVERPVIFQTTSFLSWDASARANMRREMKGL